MRDLEMTIPIWVLLGFVAWTMLLLLLTTGVYRWWLILSAQAPISGFRADPVEGADWYRRGIRAHANCIENLPVYTAIVFALYVTGVGGAAVDALSICIIAARVMQSSVHVCLPQTNAVVTVRFTFFFVQFLCFAALIVVIVRSVVPTA